MDNIIKTDSSVLIAEKEITPKQVSYRGVKKHLLIFMILWYLCEIANAIAIVMAGGDTTLNIAICIAGILFSGFVAFGIYSGIRFAAIFPAIEIFVGLRYIGLSYVALYTQHTAIKVLFIISCIAVVIRIIVVLYVLFSKQMRSYEQAMREIYNKKHPAKIKNKK